MDDSRSYLHSLLGRLEQQRWLVNYDELRARAIVVGPWSEDTVVNVEFELSHETGQLICTFLIGTKRCATKAAQPFLGCLREHLALRDFTLEQVSPALIRATWFSFKPDLFEAEATTEIEAEMDRLFEHGFHFATCCIHILTECYVVETHRDGVTRKLPSPQFLVDFCLHGFMDAEVRYAA